MRDGYQRGVLPPQATQRQMDVLAAYVAAGGSVHDAAELVGIQPSTVKRHLADLRSRMGLTTEQLIYAGRAGGWLVVPRSSDDRSLGPSVRAESVRPRTGGGQMPTPVR